MSTSCRVVCCITVPLIIVHYLIFLQFLQVAAMWSVCCSPARSVTEHDPVLLYENVICQGTEGKQQNNKVLDLRAREGWFLSSTRYSAKHVLCLQRVRVHLLGLFKVSRQSTPSSSPLNKNTHRAFYIVSCYEQLSVWFALGIGREQSHISQNNENFLSPLSCSFLIK